MQLGISLIIRLSLYFFDSFSVLLKSLFKSSKSGIDFIDFLLDGSNPAIERWNSFANSIFEIK